MHKICVCKLRRETNFTGIVFIMSKEISNHLFFNYALEIIAAIDVYSIETDIFSYKAFSG